MSETILSAESVRKTYRTGAEQVEALRSVNLAVRAGEFVAVMGPSGSGKTTLLNCLSGLDDIDSGRVVIDGQSIHDLPDARRTSHRAGSMGFIFQAFNLIPVFSAVENVELPLLLAGVAAGEARKRAIDTLERMNLAHRLNHRPTELSAGEQQRVTVARALAGRPRIVWADEPTGNLDSETAQHVMGLIHELNAEGLTLLLVTHDPAIARSASRLITMRDGNIVASEELRGHAGNGKADLDGEGHVDRTERKRERTRRRPAPDNDDASAFTPRRQNRTTTASSNRTSSTSSSTKKKTGTTRKTSKKAQPPASKR